MQKVLAVMPSLTTLPLAPSISRPPTTSSGAGLQESPLPSTPPSTPSKVEQVSLSHEAIHSMPPASEAGQAEKVSWSPKAVTSSNEEDELPGLESDDEVLMFNTEPKVL